MKKDIVDLTIEELKSLQSTLQMLNRKEMLQEVKKEIERRKKNGLKR
jgi:hypothetical protein